MRVIFVATLAASIAATPVLAQHESHSTMDHSQIAPAKDQAAPMDHSGHQPTARRTTVPNMETGGINAADAIWGADAMRAPREALYNEHGDMQLFWFQGDRLEYRARENSDGYLWDVQGYYGGDRDKLWFKSEGEGAFGETIEQAEVQALYSRAIAPFFDLQAGIRHDFSGSDRTHAVIGIQGLAPYMFEIDAAAFLSDNGDLTARIEAEYDQRISDRLILQPRAEINLSAQNIPQLGIGSGVNNVELGLRLRYEIKREFAPYIGIEQEWKFDGSKDFSRLAGEDPSITNYVVGVRFWF
ncbi:MAG: copper resistance protein B [Parasphingorhabdus sp.]|uniref:copper resistance protein B n=1 Tax=Parasphingorhabdus sp. TaxID=2709688 RepID=UPI0030020B58